MTEYAQILTAVWVNETAPEIDGVWWEDNLNVRNYSAPRGVISMNKIKEWVSSASVIQESEVIEDEYDEDE